MSQRLAIPAPRAYAPEEIRAIRARFAWSQAKFADALNVSLATVRHWEQGLRAPDGGHLRLLEIADRVPEALRAVARSRDEIDGD